MCSEAGPRISFSRDLVQEEGARTDRVPRSDTTLLESNSDFEFSICSCLDHGSSTADELFADGKILPLQFRERIDAPKQIPPTKPSLPPHPCPPPADQSSRNETMREIMTHNSELVEKPHQSKSFWGFKRSNSLNCDIKKSLICSLPLLSRSNSTGSVPNSKRTSLKDIHRHNSQKQQENSKSLSSSSSASTYVYSLPHKPPLKKTYGGSHLHRVTVLNVPPPYISKGTANLFGLGSFLRNGKEKTSRK